MLGLIKRAPRAEHYTVLNTLTFNIELTAECLGVYLYLLSKPDDWTIQVSQLSKHFGMGRDKTYKVIKTLMETNVDGVALVERKELREQGKIVGYEYTVKEPLPEKPYTAEPDTALPLTANQHITNNRSLQKTESTNNREGQNRKRFVPPTLEDVEQYAIDRQSKIHPQRFIDFYESKGWMVGKNKMKDWKAAFRTWEQRHTEEHKDDKRSLEERLTDTSWAEGLDI